MNEVSIYAFQRLFFISYAINFVNHSNAKVQFIFTNKNKVQHF